MTRGASLLGVVVVGVVAAVGLAQAQPGPPGRPRGPSAPGATDVPGAVVDAPAPPLPAPAPVAPVMPHRPEPPRPPIPGVTELEVLAPRNDSGRHLAVTFTRGATGDDLATVIFRRRWGTPNPPASYPQLLAPATAGAPRTWSVEFAGAAPPPLAKLTKDDQLGPWTVAAVLEAGETTATDEVAPDGTYEYVVAEVRRRPDGTVIDASPGAVIGPRTPEAALINTDRLGYLGIVLLLAGLIVWYIEAAKKKKDLYVRRLPGVDAIEDSIGRSTEMGRPVLYVTGLEEIQNIQTIASLLILGHVAEKTAQYDTDLVVANYYPLTMVVAEEVVRQGYANAGRIDAHRPERCLFITAEQFAFAAGVNGIILRERPATNIYFGAFYGESLLLAETGFLTGAVQIAGTAELTQLPFFITACDYTLIGEEMYAASAYLTKEPNLLANLKAADAFKVVAMVFILTGVALATVGAFQLGPWVFR
ncbi:MAG: DUF6754 domain-containing protein [Kofleriaceae bacterium]